MLRAGGLDPGIVRLIGGNNERSTAVVKKGNLWTDEFKTNSGVLQGFPLSPHLFNIFLEKIMGKH